MRVGISGFGSIGRRFFRIAFGSEEIKIVAINDVAPLEVMVHLLKYDSNYGTYTRDVQAHGDALVVDGHRVAWLQERDPAQIGWHRHGVDYVLECTGRFTDPSAAAGHLSAGARRVVISAPVRGKGAPTLIPGVNLDSYDPQTDRVVSMGSCTTNALVPVLHVLREAFGVGPAMMTTVHSYTNDQNLLDAPHKDVRRARAAGLNIIPTTTGVQFTVGQVWPELGDVFRGLSLRVPTPAVSVIDLVAQLQHPASRDELNRALRDAAHGSLLGILDYTEEPVVSSDLRQSSASATVDAQSSACAGPLCKVLAWYDNEWGYATRLGDLLRHMAQREAMAAPRAEPARLKT